MQPIQNPPSGNQLTTETLPAAAPPSALKNRSVEQRHTWRSTSLRCGASSRTTHPKKTPAALQSPAEREADRSEKTSGRADTSYYSRWCNAGLASIPESTWTTDFGAAALGSVCRAWSPPAGERRWPVASFHSFIQNKSTLHLVGSQAVPTPRVR